MDRKTQYCQDVILLNLTYRFNAILIKIPLSYFWILQTDSKVYIRVKRPRRVKRRTKLDDCHFVTYYKATVIKTMWHWQKSRQIDQGSRTESPEIDPHTYPLTDLNKGA